MTDEKMKAALEAMWALAKLPPPQIRIDEERLKKWLASLEKADGSP